MSVLGFGFQISGFGFQVSSFGFRVPGFGFQVSSVGFPVPGFRFQVSGSGFRVPGSGFRDLGSGFRDPGFGFRVSGFEFRVPGSGFRVPGFRFRVRSPVRGSRPAGARSRASPCVCQLKRWQVVDRSFTCSMYVHLLSMLTRNVAIYRNGLLLEYLSVDLDRQALDRVHRVSSFG